MTPAEILRDAWIAELWRPCPEVPRHFREEKRKADRAQQRALEEAGYEAVHNPSTAEADLPTSLSTDCAQNGSDNLPATATEPAKDVGKLPCRPNESTPGRGGCNTNASRGLAS